MDVILSIIGVLGLGALLIAAWVFVSAAKRNVNGEHIHDEFLHNDAEARRPGPSAEDSESPEQPSETDLAPRLKPRSSYDRRQHPPANVFPIIINGERINEDRRKNPDRRRAA